MLVAPFPVLNKTLLCFVSPLTFLALPEWIRAWAPLSTYLYGIYQVVPSLYLPLLGKMPSQQGIFPKRGLGRNSKIDHFSPHHQTTPSKSLHRGPTFHVLVRYKWVVLQPLCVCSTILCICLLLLPHHFCVGSWACTVSSYFPMGLDIGLAKVPAHLVRWSFVLVTSLLAMPIDLLAVILAMLTHWALYLLWEISQFAPIPMGLVCDWML